MNVDFIVLSKKEKKINPKEYFNLMLEFGVKEYNNTLQQVYFSNEKSGMERRIREMLNRNKNKKQMAIFSLIILLVSMPVTTYASVGLMEGVDSRLMLYVIEQERKTGRNIEIEDEVEKPEIYEETGIKVNISTPFTVWSFMASEDLQVIGITMLADYVSGDVQLSEEHTEYKWIEPLEFEKLNANSSLKKEIAQYATR